MPVSSSEAYWVCGSIGVVLCFTIASLAGILPHAVVDCGPAEEVSSTYTFMPAAIPNSPFGGNSSGEGILPFGFPGFSLPYGEAIGFGTGAVNGTTGIVFFSTEVVINLLQNSSRWGYGNSSPCTERFSVGTQPNGDVGPATYYVPVPSNTSDVGEAVTVNLSAIYAGPPSVPTWNNSFYSDNFGVVNTCGGGPAIHTVRTFGLNLTFNVRWNNESFAISDTLPFVEEFYYKFPADFGSWEVDNLSAPGGPGGGWAFDYLGPCS